MPRRRPVATLAVGLLGCTVLLASPAAADGAGLAGNGAVSVTQPAGSTVAVVSSSAPTDGRVSIVVANGTGAPVRVRKVVAIATDEGGDRVARASTTSVVPSVLAPGEQGLGAIRFRTDSVGFLQETFTFTATSRPVRPSDPVGLAAGAFVLSPPKTGVVAQTLDLVVTNDTTTAVEGGVNVRVACLNQAGLPSTSATRTTKRVALAPGATTPASVSFSELCPVYVVGAQATPAR